MSMTGSAAKYSMHVHINCITPFNKKHRHRTLEYSAFYVILSSLDAAGWVLLAICTQFGVSCGGWCSSERSMYEGMRE